MPPPRLKLTQEDAFLYIFHLKNTKPLSIKSTSDFYNSSGFRRLA